MDELAQRVKSPCIRSCCLGDDNVCLGCFRNLDEITSWSEADDAARRRVLRQARQRRATHEAKFEPWRD